MQDASLIFISGYKSGCGVGQRAAAAGEGGGWWELGAVLGEGFAGFLESSALSLA